MTRDRLGIPRGAPAAADGYTLSTLVGPAALAGANGMRWGPDGALYVAQAFGSQVSAVDVASGSARIVAPADGAIVAPDDLAFDSHGNLFVTEVMSARVSAIRPNGNVDVIASDVPVANGVTVHNDRIFMSEFNPEGRIWELRADGAQPRMIADGLMMPNALCLGPDNMLYFPLVPLGEVWRVALNGGVPERVIGELDIPTAVKFDAQGDLFAVESGSGAVSRIDVARGTRSEFARVAYGIDNFVFAPDGRMFVSHFTDGEVVEIAPDGMKRTAVAGGMTGPFGLCVQADGALLVADGMSLAVVDKAGGITRPAMLLQHGFPGYVRGVAADESGAFVVTNSAGQVARFAPGSEAEVLAEGLDQAMGVAILSGGEIVVCESGGGRVLGISAKGDVKTIATGLDRPTGIAEAPDGGILVSEAGAGAVTHISDGETTRVITGLGEPHGVAVSDGRVVVLDRETGTLWQAGEAGAPPQAIAIGLPSGTDRAMQPNVLPGIAGLMPGPLLPFADIAAWPDGRIAIGGDAQGSILILDTVG